MVNYIIVIAVALVSIAGLIQILKPELMKPFGLILSGLFLFWIRHKYFRIEGVSATPLGKLSSLLSSRKRRKYTKVS